MAPRVSALPWIPLEIVNAKRPSLAQHLIENPVTTRLSDLACFRVGISRREERSYPMIILQNQKSVPCTDQATRLVDNTLQNDRQIEIGSYCESGFVERHQLGMLSEELSV